jgi:hypothetical protein
MILPVVRNAVPLENGKMVAAWVAILVRNGKDHFGILSQHKKLAQMR